MRISGPDALSSVLEAHEHEAPNIIRGESKAGIVGRNLVGISRVFGLEQSSLSDAARFPTIALRNNVPVGEDSAQPPLRVLSTLIRRVSINRSFIQDATTARYNRNLTSQPRSSLRPKVKRGTNQ